MPTPRDFHIARLLGWYRIPLRSAPKVVAADYLAFYQPSGFGDGGRRIGIGIPVRGHILTTRRGVVKDEANQPRANEEYFKIQAGSLEKLSHPILAGKWKRLRFFHSTGEYLLKAKMLNDLAVNDEERAILWRSLRERAENERLYKTDSPEVLIALLGITEDQNLSTLDPLEIFEG